MNDVELQELLTKHHYYIARLEDIPTDRRARMLEALKELDTLSTVIVGLEKRLAAGEDSVRAELNPALHRKDELRNELSMLILGPDLGRMPTMYGPPWRFDREE